MTPRRCRGALLLATIPLFAGSLQAQAKPSTLLDRAMKTAGGASVLSKYRGLVWTGLGVVHLPNRDITIRGTWEIQPPDSAVVSTYDTTRGPGTLRYLILAGPQGWLKRDTTFTALPEDILAEEQHQYYLYWLLRLMPLKEKGIKLHAVFPDSAGHAGFRVERAGRLPVIMYFDSTGAVVRMLTKFALPGPVAGDDQAIGLYGSTTSNGVRWFRRMQILRAGKPYFDLEVDSLAMKQSISDPLLAGPH
jgi:hypothetical protein